MIKRKFKKSIYAENVINVAIEAFEQIAKIECVSCGEYWSCEFIPKMSHVSNIEKEFGNYMIDYMNIEDSGC